MWCTWCSAFFIFVCSNACAASCWNPSPIQVEKLSTVPFSRMSWTTWWTACCFRKSKLLPYSCSTAYNTSGINCITHCNWNLRCRISDRLRWPAEVVPVDLPSCIWDQQVFENGDRRGCNALEQSFSEGNPQRMAKCTTNDNLTTCRGC